ncbi:NACHT domain-containing protein [Roseateles sp. L2-2]|uniref:NACHT domain-containing protein n=1 Tax=Roseateles sp. L2-2 TaxID=3422597 RepID=UPI003D35D42C
MLHTCLSGNESTSRKGEEMSLPITGAEASLITSTFGPAKGLVDAILAPKLEKLKQWSKDRELIGDMTEERLTKSLSGYLSRLLQRTSEVTTIVFPQRKIPIGSIYEELRLQAAQDPYYGTRDAKAPNSVDIQSLGKSYLIVDDAGMGKSTYLKFLSLQIVEKTDRIPILFELSTFNAELSLTENLARLFDDIDRSFSRELFARLIAKGKFVIILDGYDELPSASQDNVRKQIADLSLKKQGSTLIVSSRPREQFPDLAGVSHLSLERFEAKQAKALLQKYDEIAGIKISDALIAEFGKIETKFLETPLLLGLLYRTFAFNNSIANKSSAFYSELFEALFKGHDLTKSGFVREKSSALDIDRFRALLRAFSFYYILNSSRESFGEEAIIKAIDDARKICPSSLTQSRPFFEDLLAAVPLLLLEGRQIKFMHRTIAEYFAAEYIINTENPPQLLLKISSGRARESFQETVEFVGELSPTLYREIITKPIAKEFLAHCEGMSTHSVYTSLVFTDQLHLSYWLRSEVEKKRKGGHDIRIPQPERSARIGHAMVYFYGEMNNSQYVAAITFGSRRNIPPAAFADLSMPDGSRAHGQILMPGEDPDISFLAQHFAERTWYSFDDDPAKSLSHTSQIIRLICSIQIFGGHGGRNNSSTEPRYLCKERASSVIAEIDAFTQAKSDLDSLLS